MIISSKWCCQKSGVKWKPLTAHLFVAKTHILCTDKAIVWIGLNINREIFVHRSCSFHSHQWFCYVIESAKEIIKSSGPIILFGYEYFCYISIYFVAKVNFRIWSVKRKGWERHFYQCYRILSWYLQFWIISAIGYYSQDILQLCSPRLYKECHLINSIIKTTNEIIPW